MQQGHAGQWPMHGNQVGRPIQKFNFQWKVLFFAAAACTIAAGIIGLVTATGEVRPTKCINQSFLIVFGVFLAIIDMPDNFTIKAFKELKDLIFKHFLFMTRFTGRGIWYLFLGCSIYTSLDGEAFALAVILGVYVAGLGAFSIFHGVRKTIMLEQYRQAIKGRDDPDTCPPQGWSKDDFRENAAAMQGQMWDEEMMIYVLNALSLQIKADDHVSKEEFDNWLAEPLAALL